MTISVNDRVVTAVGDGIQTVYTYDFDLESTTEVEVYLSNVVISSGLYSVSLDPKTITFTTAPADSVAIAIVGKTSVQQLYEGNDINSVSTAAIEEQFDKNVKIAQEIDRELSRTVKAEFGSAGPTIETIAEGRFYKTDSNGNLVDGGSADDIINAEGYATAAEAAKVAAEAAASALEPTLKGYGAVGDGVTNDAAAFTAADAAQTAGTVGPVYIPAGNYVCTGVEPTGLYYGPGKVQFGDGNSFTDSTFWDIASTPNYIFANLHANDKRGLGFVAGPGAGKAVDLDENSSRFFTLIGDRAGAGALTPLRSTVVGSGAARDATDLQYLDAFGASAMQHLTFGNRNIAIGSNAMKWGGNATPVADEHDFWDDDKLSVWTAKKFEDRYANIRFDLLDGVTASTYTDDLNPTSASILTVGDVKSTRVPTAETDFENNIAIGRDALIHAPLGGDITTVGYKSMASHLFGSRAAVVGRSALEYSMNNIDMVAVGYNAGEWTLANETSVLLGSKVVPIAISTSNSVVIGADALDQAYDYTDAAHKMTSITDYKLKGVTAIGFNVGPDIDTIEASILIGKKAGIASTDLDEIFILQDGGVNATPMLVGDLSNNRVGVNVFHDLSDGTTQATGALLGQFHVREGSTGAGVTPNTGADTLLLERNGNAGMSVMIPNSGTASWWAATPASNNEGGWQYDAPNQELIIKSGDTVIITVHGNGEVEFNNLPTSAPTGANKIWKNGTSVDIT